jgi:hypothetical protein
MTIENPPGASSGSVAAILGGVVVGLAAAGIGYWIAEIPGMIVGFVLGDAVAILVWRTTLK